MTDQFMNVLKNSAAACIFAAAAMSAHGHVLGHPAKASTPASQQIEQSGAPAAKSPTGGTLDMSTYCSEFEASQAIRAVAKGAVDNPDGPDPQFMAAACRAVEKLKNGPASRMHRHRSPS